MSFSTRLNLSREQQEIVCSILLHESLLSNEWIAKERKQLLIKLSDVYEHGDLNTLRDKYKAHEYRNHLTADTTQDTVAPKSVIASIHQWFTAARMMLVRFNRFLSYTNHGFLPKIFSVLGLSYGVTFLIDLIIIGIDVFDPNIAEHEQHFSTGKRILQRLALAFNDRERLARMTTDFVWFVVNLLTIILLGPIAVLWAPVISLTGNAHDAIHDGIFSWINNNAILDVKYQIELEIQKNNETILKLTNDLKKNDTILTKEIQHNYAIYNETLEQQKRALKSENPLLIKRTDTKLSMIKRLAPAKNNRLITDVRKRMTALEEEKKAIVEETIALQAISDQFEERLKEADKVATRIVVGAVLVVIGLCLTCIFPPVGLTFSVACLPGIIGAGLAITGSCVMRGAIPLIVNGLTSIGKKINQFFNPPTIIHSDFVATPEPKPKESTLAMKRMLQLQLKNQIIEIPSPPPKRNKAVEYKATVGETLSPRKLGLR